MLGTNRGTTKRRLRRSEIGDQGTEIDKSTEISSIL